MSNENQSEGAAETTEEFGGDEGMNDTSGATLTRSWPAVDPKGPNLLNPLEDHDFAEVFSTTLHQAFLTEEEIKSKNEKPGPEDTAEDPIPEV